jgi:hypothetical protein
MGPVLRKRLCFGGIAIPDGELVARFEEPPGDAASHRAEPDDRELGHSGREDPHHDVGGVEPVRRRKVVGAGG